MPLYRILWSLRGRSEWIEADSADKASDAWYASIEEDTIGTCPADFDSDGYEVDDIQEMEDE